MSDLIPIEHKEKQGPTEVRYRSNSKLLNGNNYMGFDYTINPYIGCSHACGYCYAAAFVGDENDRARWGEWVDVKENALGELHRNKGWMRKNILMGSATDCYQPIEEKLQLTRGILKIFAEPFSQPAIHIITRGPLVTRDIDLFQQFRHLKINFSITTDNEDSRKLHEPQCASLDRRWAAITALRDAGIRVGINIAPMLPLQDARAFGRRLREFGAASYFIDTFNKSYKSFQGTTREDGWMTLARVGWTPKTYERDKAILMEELPPEKLHFKS